MSGPAIVIGSHRYFLAELPPQARSQCLQIEFCEQHIACLQREVTLLQQVRTEAAQVLPSLLPGQAEAGPGGNDISKQKRRRYWPSAPACKPRR